jgi:exodeoxyribonuclease VII large subunit
MVADLRASTPTAAAEAVAPAAEEVAARFQGAGALLARGLRHAAQRAARRLAAVEGRRVLADPRTLLLLPAQRLDLAAAGLARALPAAIARDRERMSVTERALPRAVQVAMSRQRERAAMFAARLQDLSPLGILARGYAVCYDESGRRVVRSAREIAPGDVLHLRLNEGSVGCRVEDVRTEVEG